MESNSTLDRDIRQFFFFFFFFFARGNDLIPFIYLAVYR